jgi:NADH:ubiquinone oxidoreductase subunit 6 (subunit J)
MDVILFYILASVLVLSALAVVTIRNIFRAALLLVLLFVALAAVYVTLGAEFVAAAQVLIYVGAVTILIIFAIMLTQRISDRSIRQSSEQKAVSFLVVLVLLGLLLLSIGTTIRAFPKGPGLADTIPTIGEEMMSTYLLPFEVVSVLLLVALLGAIVLARRDE